MNDGRNERVARKAAIMTKDNEVDEEVQQNIAIERRYTESSVVLFCSTYPTMFCHSVPLLSTSFRHHSTFVLELIPFGVFGVNCAHYNHNLRLVFFPPSLSYSSD